MRQQRFPCVRCGKRLTVNQVTFHTIRCQAAARKAMAESSDDPAVLYNGYTKIKRGYMYTPSTGEIIERPSTARPGKSPCQCGCED